MSHSYDIILNGIELGGGSIRIHTADLQRKVFQVRGYTDAEIEELFGHMLEAFEYGAPPHGGIAFGIDRIVMVWRTVWMMSRAGYNHRDMQNAVRQTRCSSATWSETGLLLLQSHRTGPRRSGARLDRSA